MGQGGYIVIYNGTRYRLKLDSVRSYQMDSWNSSFSDLEPGQVKRLYVEFDENIFHNPDDDGGEAYYSVTGTESQRSHQFHFRATFRNISIVSSGLSNLGSFSYDMGWNHNGNMIFALAGREGHFLASNYHSAASGWMRDNLDVLGSKTLRQLCISGSHDAGMSVNTHHTTFSPDAVVITQTKTIYNQLLHGVRWFDIRPIIGSGQFFCGHYTDTHNDVIQWQGGRGQPMNEVISQLNQFTSTSKELIVLYLSHAYNTDVGRVYMDFTTAEWQRLFSLLSGSNGIRDLFITQARDLSRVSLREYLQPDKAAVIISVDVEASVLGDYGNKGFYDKHRLSTYNQYTNTNEEQKMIADQLTKLEQYHGSSYFALAWQLTLSNHQCIKWAMGIAIGVPTNLDLAKEANQELVLKIVPRCSSTCYPNIILIDDVRNGDATCLALALSLNSSG